MFVLQIFNYNFPFVMISTDSPCHSFLSHLYGLWRHLHRHGTVHNKAFLFFVVVVLLTSMHARSTKKGERVGEEGMEGGREREREGEGGREGGGERGGREGGETEREDGEERERGSH